jgi:hypothetical protein
MTLPHEKAFRLRALLFWLAAIASAYLAWQIPGIDGRLLLWGFALAAVLAVAAYYYALWLMRLDAKFRHVHPRKFAISTLVVFYGSVGLAVGLYCYALWFTGPAADAPIAQAVCFLLAPALLAGAGAAVRVRHECASVPPDVPVALPGQ